MTSQLEKARAFRSLHERSGVFVIPNPWDSGSARLLEALGFGSLATTSSGFAQSIGRLDGMVALDEKLRHCAELSAATNVAISADLENGFADKPNAVASCIQRVAETGVVGGSIEDFTGNPNRPIYDLNLAVERISAASEAARGLQFPFTLTARAENLLRADDDIDETIKRLQAYEAAGADVLYAPALKSLEDVRLVASSVNKPLNVLATPFKGVTVEELGEAGAKRVSTGGGLARLAISALLSTASDLKKHGNLDWTSDLAPISEIEGLLSKWTNASNK